MENEYYLQFKENYGYWDVTHYPYGGDFKRIAKQKGKIIAGPVKNHGEIRVKLDDGKTIIIRKDSVTNMDWDKMDTIANEIGMYNI